MKVDTSKNIGVKLEYEIIDFIVQAVLTVTAVVFLFIGLVTNVGDSPYIQAVKIVYLVAFLFTLFYAVYGYKLFKGILLKYVFMVNDLAIGLQTLFFLILGIPLAQAIIMLVASLLTVYIAGRFSKSNRELYILFLIDIVLLFAYFIYAIMTSHKLAPESGFEAVRRIFEILVPLFLFGSAALSYIARQSKVWEERHLEK